MRLLPWCRGDGPRAKTIRPAERYLAAGAAEARRLGCSFVGTEHVLLALLHSEGGGTATSLERLGVTPAAVESALAPCLAPAPGPGPGPGSGSAKIDAEALASLGIDFDAVRARLERTFGPGALERSPTSCLGIAPRLKLALAYALDRADNEPLSDEHVLLGMLSVPDSVAARALGSLGVTIDRVQPIRPSEPSR